MKKNKLKAGNWKRLFSMILSLALILTMMPMNNLTVYADSSNVDEFSCTETSGHVSRNNSKVTVTYNSNRTAIENIKFNVDLTFNGANAQTEWYNIAFVKGAEQIDGYRSNSCYDGNTSWGDVVWMIRGWEAFGTYSMASQVKKQFGSETLRNFELTIDDDDLFSQMEVDETYTVMLVRSFVFNGSTFTDCYNDAVANISVLSQKATFAGTLFDGIYANIYLGEAKKPINISETYDTTDTDGDGLPDVWETNGICHKNSKSGKYELLDLPAMGADPNKPDIFVEVDWMDVKDPVTNTVIDPTIYDDAMYIVYKQFADHGINLHIDAGQNSIDYVTGKQWGKMSCANSTNSVFNIDIYDNPNYEPWLSRNYELIKNEFTDNEVRSSVFRHCIMGNYLKKYILKTDISGYTFPYRLQNQPGQYFTVALGCLLNYSKNDPGNKRTMVLATTFMHELGHSLGLYHGGFVNNIGDDTIYKQNYLSIMNYDYQEHGLPNTGINLSDTTLSRDDLLPLVNYQDKVIGNIDSDWNHIRYDAGVIGAGAGYLEEYLEDFDNGNIDFETIDEEPIDETMFQHNISSKYTCDSVGHWCTCSHCSEKIYYGEHVQDEGTVTVEPTETTEGVRTYRCAVCGYIMRTEKIPAGSSEDPIPAFVERLYKNILGRSSDSAGKSKHVQHLKDGETACKVAYDFVFSQEFLKMQISNEERVRRMYLTFLDREPDAAGLANWTNQLNNGCSVGRLFYGFTRSNEFTGICKDYGINRGSWDIKENRDKSPQLTAFVSRLYTKALGRSYDVKGLNDHTGKYIANEDMYALAYSFIFSSEYKNKNLSDEDFVENMYETFFDRHSDPSGKAGWLVKMKNGMKREDVLKGFIGSKECKDLIAKFGL